MRPTTPNGQDFAIYVHWPFCVSKCPYCDFNSHPQRPDNDYATYTAALIADLNWTTQSFERRPLRSVFFGGGTPSLCPPQHIAEILAALERRLGFAQSIEVTLEANPGTVDADHFRGYRSAGVNRLSIGVQSFHGPSLRRLGRIHDGDQARNAIRIARAAGFDNIAAEVGLDWGGALPLEQLVMLAPDVIVRGRDYPGQSRAEDNLTHPALRTLTETRVAGTLTDRDWICGTPQVLNAIRDMRDLRLTLQDTQ